MRHSLYRTVYVCTNGVTFLPYPTYGPMLKLQRLMLILPYVSCLFYVYIFIIPLLYILYAMVYLLYSLLDYSFPQIVNSLSIIYYTVYCIFYSFLFPLP